MSKLALVAAVVLGFGCGGKERKMCEHINDLCKGEATSKELDQCATDLRETKDELGDQYDKLLTCGIEAESCMEAVGCGAGAALNLGGDAMKELEKGFSKMRK